MLPTRYRCTPAVLLVLFASAIPGIVAYALRHPRRDLHQLTLANAADHSGLTENANGSVLMLEVTNHGFWLYTTTIAVGNPPQSFQAAIDIGWSDSWVPSISCSDSVYCDPHPLYDAANSSSYNADGRNVSLHHWAFYTRGIVSRDSMHIGDLEVGNVTFEEASMVHPVYFFDDTWYDAALGLAREVVVSEESTLQVQSPFQHMIQQKLLKRNMFSLLLPQTTLDVGMLTIGGLPDKAMLSHLAVTLPTIGKDSDPHVQDTFYLSGGWEVNPVSMSFGHHSNVVRYDLSNHVAAFSTMDFAFDIPYAFYEVIRDTLDIDGIDGSVECDKIDAGLPNLVISLKGYNDQIHDFVVTPADYIRFEPREPFIDPKRCQCIIAFHDETKEDVPRFISLGSVFLSKYLSIFDNDAKAITLSPLSEHRN